jgi:hypothetical protein
VPTTKAALPSVELSLTSSFTFPQFMKQLPLWGRYFLKVLVVVAVTVFPRIKRALRFEAATFQLAKIFNLFFRFGA